MSLPESCQIGFRWDGKPAGNNAKLGDIDCYVTGSNQEAVVLIIHDIFGWSLVSTRLLADHYAEEANVTVYLPDLFHGDVVSPEIMEEPEQNKTLDWKGFMSRNNKPGRTPDVFTCARLLREQYGFTKLGAVGFCYGGYAALQLASEKGLLDCVSVAHPSLVNKSELDAIAAPVQILAPEHDEQFSVEFKEHALKVLPTLGVDYAYVHFQGLEHGFATMGNMNDERQRRGLERAKDDVAGWFRRYLH